MAIRRKHLCPHCKHDTIQYLAFTHVYDEQQGALWDRGAADPDFPSAYFLFICETCDEVLLYHAENADENTAEELFAEEIADLLWPEPPIPKKIRALHDSAPQSVKDSYARASRVKDEEPNSFAVQIRRALEAICNDLGIAGNNLDQQLRKLSSQGIYLTTITEIADELRLLGNIGAHADERSVSPEQVKAIDDFFSFSCELCLRGSGKTEEVSQFAGDSPTFGRR